jgi:hypothetical protein
MGSAMLRISECICEGGLMTVSLSLMLEEHEGRSQPSYMSTIKEPHSQERDQHQNTIGTELSGNAALFLHETSMLTAKDEIQDAPSSGTPSSGKTL